MRYPVAYLWIENPRSERLAIAQARLEESVRHYGLDPVRFPAGRDLVQIGKVLEKARSCARGDSFVWCNSDVVLTRNPYDVPDLDKVYGFYRREIPSGEVIRGVDMYTIPVKWWDEYLSKDIPKLYLGASYVDRWISRAMQKAVAYENLTGYIDHISHPQSPESGSDANPYYQKNFLAYNRWAMRNGLDCIEAPPYLIPKIGHVWGIRDAFRRIFK